MNQNNTSTSFLQTIIGIVLLLPSIALAAPANFRELLGLGMKFVQGLTGIAWIFLLLVFIYNVIKFLMNFDDERAREEGKRSMLFSLLATAVVVMVWGLISLLTNSFFGTTNFGIPLLTPP